MVSELIGLGVGLTMGLVGLGCGYGMGIASSAAIAAITEKPEIFGKTVLYVVFIEAIAIYGLIVSIILTGTLG
ncbi:MAG: ATP synthase subunit C [Candidatus Heimdallarchaeota archaeon]